MLIALIASLPGCSVITGEYLNETPESETPVSTEFGRMLGYVPYSWLANHDIWYKNHRISIELSGLDDFDTLEEYMELPEEVREQMMMEAIEEMESLPDDVREQKSRISSDTSFTSLFFARWPEFHSLVGFDVLEVDCSLSGNIIPPRCYNVIGGDFDEALIGQKLIEQGYTKTDYGEYYYYGIRDDFKIDIMHPLGRLVMGSMNRVAVLDNLIVTSPVTADITGIFDAMAGDTPSAIDNAACRALADSLGDALMTVITTPERIIFSDLASDEEPPIMFDFTLPDDWGILRGYEMTAIGSRLEGDDYLLIISLIYADEKTARNDSDEIINRMQSYLLNTWFDDMENVPFTDWYRIDEPVIQKYPGGVMLTITCHPLPGERRGASSLTGRSGMPFRDLLFLAPDPAPYIGKNDEPDIIYIEKP